MLRALVDGARLWLMSFVFAFSPLAPLAPPALAGGALARPGFGAHNGQTFDRTFNALGKANQMIVKNGTKAATKDAAPVYTPEQQTTLQTVARATLALAASPLAHCVTLALGETVIDGLVTSNGRDMSPARRDVMADISARTSPSTAKGQMARALWLWDNFNGDIRECGPLADSVAEMTKRLAARDIRDQYTLDVARGAIVAKAKALDAVEKAEKALETAKKKRDDAADEAARVAAYHSPDARVARIIEAITPGGFTSAHMEAIAKALRDAPTPEMLIAKAAGIADGIATPALPAGSAVPHDGTALPVLPEPRDDEGRIAA